LDSIGELASVYKLSSVSFVGGSLDKNKTGGHNPLEVLQQKVPLIMGSYYRNFTDIVEQLKSLGGISIIENANQTFEIIEKIINNETIAYKMVSAGNEVLESNKGVVVKTLEIAKKLIQ
ncbi:MAG: 3-deoxy-D-manno-octulosonic acid transferase, partial [Candidatus Riflebacteria bacterium]|nr:3-deoxy-D-manno-octulosonic acid transferase [Candidatus Riflebacteria bacterium]